MTGSSDPPASLGSTDAASVVTAIEEAASRLAGEPLDDAEASALAHSIVAHASHARAKVRQAVAQAAVHLPEAPFEAVIGELLRDPNQYVKRAATRSFDERSRQRRARRVQDESSADVRQLRARIADDFTEQAARAADRLADLTLAEFVARFHHELVKVATPLRVTLGDLRDETRRAAGERLAGRAEEAFARLDLLLGIAQSARVHAKVTAPKFRDETLRRLVEEHVDLLRARIGAARNARLKLTVDADATLAAEIDRGLFGQALSNLLQNAVESYAPEGDDALHVCVTGERRSAGTRVALTVEDRGRGIPADSIPHIGGAFVSSKGAGRGLGVLNVKRMIETVHGGQVEVESEVGRGTRVTVVVPRRQ